MTKARKLFMSKKMLIDAAHKEEVRIAVLDENRLDDYEVETTGKEQIKGNIYIGEVTRVEASLQAAFISYGGNRNGFLAFSELHPSCFSVEPEEKEMLLSELDEIAERRKNRDKVREEELEKRLKEKEEALAAKDLEPLEETLEPKAENLEALTAEEMEEDARALALATAMAEDNEQDELPINTLEPIINKRPKRHFSSEEEVLPNSETEDTEASSENEQEKERKAPIHRRYAIQDVLKTGQKVLVQVNKEERGNKGAALSTYISLPGRFCVLMPNTPYAGGISRKITDMSARRELKRIVKNLDMPENMGLIVRTAGVGQEEELIQKDVQHLLKHWTHIKDIYETTTAKPLLVHEDGSLPIRSVRDSFNAGIDEVIISGRKTYRNVKEYVKRIMPERAKQIKEHRAQSPLFIHHDVEPQINRLHATRVNLPSGGYLIINPTEALVSIDVNSGRATQEKNIEETALKTNLEAAEEVARQLRLRDLAGLVVIDFIDMEDRKNERSVEKCMRRQIKKDRARLQIASISDFGLMEMSRQRLRPSLGESTMTACPHCHGTGLLPSLDTAALAVLRSIEAEDIRDRADRVTITTSTELALHILNNKRALVKDLETRYNLEIFIRGDERYVGPDHRLDIIRIDARGNEKSHTIEVTLRDNPEAEDNLKKKRRRGTRGGKTTQKKEMHDKNINESSTEAAEEETTAKTASQEEHSEEDSSKKKGGRTRRLRRNRKNNRQKEETSNEDISEKENADKPSENKEELKTESSQDDSEKKQNKRQPRRPRRYKKEASTETSENPAPLPEDDAKEQKSKKSEEIAPAEKSEEKKPRKRRTTKKKTSTSARTKRSAEENSSTNKPAKKQHSKPKAKVSKGITVETIDATGSSSVSKEEGSAVSRAFQRWWGKSEDNK